MITTSIPYVRMKFHPLSTICTGLGLLGTMVLAKDPVLNTPGTASWTSGTTSTGTRTVFTLTGNTVLSWDQLNLSKGSELVFDFVSGKSVVNFLGGTGTHVIDGTVTSNGNVAFFSPTADLLVNGSIIAKEVTLATLNANADEFFNENGYELTGSGDFNLLSIEGSVEATGGDVVLGGLDIKIGGAAQIQASRDLLIGGSQNFRVANPGAGKRITENSGDGFVLNLGTARGSRIEIAASNAIRNQGTIEANSGNKIFLRVNTNGKITNETTGVIIGDVEFDGDYENGGAILTWQEGDAAPAISEGSVTFPALSRPDGTAVPTSAPNESNPTENLSNPETTTDSNQSGNPGNTMPVNASLSTRGSSSAGKESFASRTISYSVPMSASGDAGRDSAAIQRNRKQVSRVDGSKSLLQRSSFFGMRGGTTTVTAKR